MSGGAICEHGVTRHVDYVESGATYDQYCAIGEQ